MGQDGCENPFFVFIKTLIPKNKKKNQENKKINNNKKHRISKPEEMFFGSLILVSIFVGAYCFAGAGQIPENLPSAVYHKPVSGTEKNIEKMARGYPIKKMSAFIGRKDDRVAAFLVAIAKKESNWGKFSPKDNGRECYNYWGYRGPENPTASGYSCFDSPKQAVDIVGRRLKNLIAEKIDTPQEMVMWKCGPHCNRHESLSAEKWVSDVNFYYRQFYD
jgi:hypothetical protein